MQESAVHPSLGTTAAAIVSLIVVLMLSLLLSVCFLCPTRGQEDEAGDRLVPAVTPSLRSLLVHKSRLESHPQSSCNDSRRNKWWFRWCSRSCDSCPDPSLSP